MICEQCGKNEGRKRKGKAFVICVSCENKLREEIMQWQENENKRRRKFHVTDEMCPRCRSYVPIDATACARCGYVWNNRRWLKS